MEVNPIPTFTKYSIRESRAHTVHHHTNTDDTCSSQHDAHDHAWLKGLFQSIRGCKQTRWVQAWIIVIDIAVALIGGLHDGCYGCIVSF